MCKLHLRADQATEQLDRFTEAHKKGVSQMAQELDTLWQLVTQCINGSRTDMDSFLQESETKRSIAQEQVRALLGRAWLPALPSRRFAATRSKP